MVGINTLQQSMYVLNLGTALLMSTTINVSHFSQRSMSSQNKAIQASREEKHKKEKCASSGKTER